MTIRRSVNIAATNADYMHFEEALQHAPAGMFEQARAAANILADAANSFLQAARDADLTVCNCDGIREIEAMMFAMLRDKNPGSQIEQAIGLGKALEYAEQPGAGITKADIIGRLERDRNFVQSQIDKTVDDVLDAVCAVPIEQRRFDNLIGRAVAEGHVTPDEGATIAATTGIDRPGSFRADSDLLTAGRNTLWMVPVECSFDDSDYVNLEVRAPTEEIAASKAEAFARKHAEMLFDLDVTPTFSARRRDIERVEAEEAEVYDGEEQYTGSDAPFPGTEA